MEWPRQAALSGSHPKAPGFAGGYLLSAFSVEGLVSIPTVYSEPPRSACYLPGECPPSSRRGCSGNRASNGQLKDRCPNRPWPATARSIRPPAYHDTAGMSATRCETDSKCTRELQLTSASSASPPLTASFRLGSRRFDGFAPSKPKECDARGEECSFYRQQQPEHARDLGQRHGSEEPSREDGQQDDRRGPIGDCKEDGQYRASPEQRQMCDRSADEDGQVQTPQRHGVVSPQAASQCGEDGRKCQSSPLEEHEEGSGNHDDPGRESDPASFHAYTSLLLHGGGQPDEPDLERPGRRVAQGLVAEVLEAAPDRPRAALVRARGLVYAPGRHPPTTGTR